MQNITYQRKQSADERRRLYHSDCRHIQWGEMLHMCPALSLLVCHMCYEHFTLDAIRHDCII